MKNKKKGFTLIELIIVIAIIAILVAVVAPRISYQMREAKLTGVSNNKRTLERYSILAKTHDDINYDPETYGMLFSKELFANKDIDSLINPFNKGNKGLGIILFESQEMIAYSSEMISENNNNMIINPAPEELTDAAYIIIGMDEVDASFLPEGSVYVIFNPMDGELALGENIDKTGPDNNEETNLQLPNGLAVKEVSFGLNHTLILASNGDVYGLGFTDEGQLGMENSTIYKNPVKISGISDVKQVVAADNLSYFLKNDGTVYVCGSSWGTIPGIADTRSVMTVTKIKNASNITQMACDPGIIMLLASDGKVHVAGSNYFGQLGFNPDTIEEIGELTVSTQFSNVKQIALGNTTTYILKNDGTVYYTGTSVADENAPKVYIPSKINGVSNIQQIAALGHGVTFTSSNGSVYALGVGYNGAFANESLKDKYNMVKLSTPTIINGANNVKKTSMLGNATAFLKNDSTVYLTGVNGTDKEKNAMLLGDNVKITYTPLKIGDYSNVNAIFSGSDNLAIVFSDGTAKILAQPSGVSN